MGEYEDRGRDRDHARTHHYAPSGSHQPSPPAPTPAERARDAVATVTWRLSSVKHASAELAAATNANDPKRWLTAKRELDAVLFQAQRAIERTKLSLDGATAETLASFEAMTSTLAAQAEAASVAERPTGYTAVANEALLIAAFREATTPAELTPRLEGLIEGLAIADLRVLVHRIAIHLPNDPLAGEIWELGAERRDRVRDYIREVDRDKARASAGAKRAPNPKPVATEPETLDRKLRRALEAPQVEPALIAVVDHEDDLARRGLADRLRRYRPGSGDAIAAQFAKLAPAVRTRVLAQLARDKPRDFVHASAGDLGMLAAPSMLAVAAPAPADPIRAEVDASLGPSAVAAEVDASLGPSAIAAEVDASLGAAPRSAIDAEVEHSLGPVHAVAPHDLTDRFDAAVAAVSKTYVFEDRVPAALPSHRLAQGYLALNANAAWDALRSYLADVSWPELATGLEWQSEPRFSEGLVRAMRRGLPALSAAAVTELLYPHDVFAIIDGLRPDHRADRWVPAIGLALGQLVQRVGVGSLRRIGPRIVDAADDAGYVDPAMVPVSHPMDRFVLHALREPATIAILGREHHTSTPHPRTIHLVWQGAVDPGAWNWVRAEPANATAEEVVAQLAREPGGSDAWFAAALAVAPPLFGVPAAWARKVPEAAAHLRTPLSERALDLRSDTPEARLVELTHHALATTAAIGGAAETPQTAMTVAEVGDVCDACTIQLATIEGGLSGWQLESFARDARDQVRRVREGLITASASDVTTWGAIAKGQRRRLSAIGEALGRIDRQLATLKPHDREAAVTAMRPIVRTLASATATSHIAAASDALFADAMRAQADLRLDAVQAQILDVAVTTGVPIASQRGDTVVGTSATERRLALEAEAAIGSARVANDELINGREPTEREVGEATVRARETALHGRIYALFTLTGQLQVAAGDAGSGVSGHVGALFSSRFRNLQDVTAWLRHEIDRIEGAWSNALHPDHKINPDGSWPEVTDLAQRNAALAVAEHAYSSIRDDQELMKVLADGQELIEAQQLRTLFFKIATLIVTSLVAQSAAGVVAESIATSFMTMEGAAAIGELSATAQILTRASAFGVDVGVNTVGQAVFTDVSLKQAAIDNLVFAVGGRLIAGAGSAEVKEARAFASMLDRELARTGVVESGLATVTSLGLTAIGWVGRTSTKIVGETLVNVALGNLAARLQGQPSATPTEARDWFVTALSVAVGHAVHAALGERMPGLERLAKRTDATAAERRLLADAMELDELAGRFAETRIGNAEAALRLLEQRSRLLEHELALVEWRARLEVDPTAIHEIEARRDELQTQADNARTAAMVAIRLNLIGLEELIPGQTWRGTSEDIHRAASELSAAHRVSQTWDSARKVTVLTVDDLALEIHVRPAAARTETRRESHELATELERVPGSAIRGTTPGAPVATAADLAALRDESAAAMSRIAHAADVTAIEPLDHERYVVTLRDASLTVMDISIVRIEDYDVARLLPNSSRENRIGTRTAHGEHVIQLSSHLAIDQVERVLADAVARLAVVHQRAQRGSFGNGPQGELSTDTTGRLAELRVLVAELPARPEQVPTIRREITALADHLGAIGSDVEARTRRERLEQHLSREERAELERAGRDRATLDEVRDVARDDLAADLARDRARGNDRPAQYDLAPRIGRADLERFAAAAARLRALESQRTLQRLRAAAAKLPPASYVRVEDVQLGGGVALAGRLPTTLLVDLRGRWQADGSTDIAQTAQQLGELYKARFGDTRQVAAPNERVPLAAIRFWEDSLAAMGPVIDGGAALRMDGDRMLVDVTPTDGSEMLTLEVGRTPTIASGFVPEAVPGSPRMNMVDVMTTLETELDKITHESNVEPTIRDAAQIALLRLRAIDRPRATDGTVAEALAGPHEGQLKAELRRRDTTGLIGDESSAAPKIATKAAIGTAEAGERWAKLIADDASDGISQVAFGDEANLDYRVTQLLSQLDGKLQPTAARPLRVVIAGAGGTAISAAAIILEHANTTVTMLGKNDTPTGLLANTQFRELATAHADRELATMLGIHAGDGRLKMFLDEKVRFEVPTIGTDENGNQTFEAYPARDGHPGEFVGDAYVIAAGRAPQTPPIVSDLVMQTIHGGGTVSYRADFDADEQYTGYTVTLTRGGKAREVKITGAASRYIPIETLEAQTGKKAAKVRRASGDRDNESRDVPPAAGGFPGGAAGSAVQGHRHVARDNRAVTIEEVE